MEDLAVALVLVSALLHALWNALVKAGGDPLSTLGILLLVRGSIGLAVVPFTAAPAAESWPFIAASVVIYQAYFGTLAIAYRMGDLSLVYPVSRGAAPLLVAAFALALAGETLSGTGLAGLMTVAAGLVLFAFSRRSEGLGGKTTGVRASGLLWALGVGLTIALYTVMDGLGVRASGAPLGFIAWLFFTTSAPFVLLVLAVRRGRLDAALSQTLRGGLAAGLFSTCAYGLVVWAMSILPLAVVASLRETSVVIAAVIGALLFKESLGGRRIIAAGVVLAGIVLLRLA